MTELQWRDIFVLVPDPSDADRLVRGLRQAAVPVAVVDWITATAGDWEDLALARTDRVTVTDHDCVRGLERQVVVGVGEGGGTDCRPCHVSVHHLVLVCWSGWVQTLDLHP